MSDTRRYPSAVQRALLVKMLGDYTLRVVGVEMYLLEKPGDIKCPARPTVRACVRNGWVDGKSLELTPAGRARVTP